MSRTILIVVAAAAALSVLVVVRRHGRQSEPVSELAVVDLETGVAPSTNDASNAGAARPAAGTTTRSGPLSDAKLPAAPEYGAANRPPTGGFAAIADDDDTAHLKAARPRSDGRTTAVSAAAEPASESVAFGARRPATGAAAPLINDSSATVERADAAAGDAAKDDSLLLSLPFDKSSQPDKGDEPFVADGVKIDENGAQFSSDSQFAVTNPGLKGDAGTISFWVRPEDLGTEGTDNSLVQLREQNQFENRIQIGMTPKHLSFMLADSTGVESPTGTDVAWQPGTWYQVTATWGEQTTRLYVDGQKVSENTYAGELNLHPTTPLYIGSDYPGQMPGPRGTLRNFQVYNRTQNPDEIAQQAAIPPR